MPQSEGEGGFRRIFRLFHTVRYLRPVQVYGRLWYRLYRPRPDIRLAPAIRPDTRSFLSVPARQPSLLGECRFWFLNQEGMVTRPGDWNVPDQPKLWLYNLHFFDDLRAQGAAERAEWHRDLIGRWIGDNAPGQGVGWEPYPTSLRIVNWIKWALADNPLDAPWLDSLAVQARWLARRLEWHLLGNHLFANAKALVFVGLFFDGPEAEGWLNTGLWILACEVPEQILADGGQFERSPMYHALAVEDMLDLINLTAAYAQAAPARWGGFVETWPETVGRMRSWLSAMCHPDGEGARSHFLGRTP